MSNETTVKTEQSYQENGTELVRALLNAIINIIKFAVQTSLIMAMFAIKFVVAILNKILDSIVNIIHSGYENIPEDKRKAFLKKVVSISLVAFFAIGGIFIKIGSSSLGAISTTTQETKEEGFLAGLFDNATKLTDSMIGFETIKIRQGNTEPGYINEKGYARYSNNGEVNVEIATLYGIGEFNSNSNANNSPTVIDFLKYVNETDNTFYSTYFTDEVGMPGTSSFNEAWKKAANAENEKFLSLQMNYLNSNLVEPTTKALKDTYKIDTNNKAIQELVFSMATQYGKEGALYVFEQADAKKGMDSKELIELIETERINSLGNYTITNDWKYDDIDRSNWKTKLEQEKQMLLNM